MKIVIKVGTQSILSEDGTPLESVMHNLVDQIVQLHHAGHQVILVSSGAVGSGRKVARDRLGREYGVAIGEKQLLASLGQHELIHTYTRLLQPHNILVSQILLTKLDFHTRQHYLNIARLLNEILLHKNIVPIINENDSVAIQELMFTDNDELAGLIAAQVGADKLVILSNVPGVYTGNPSDDNAELIPVIHPDKGWPAISATVSKQGRGGMVSKLGTARKMSSLGITTHIASMNEKHTLIDIVNGKEIGTLIMPSRKKSTIKRWIAFSTGEKSGAIVVNACLYDLLKENQRAMSLLPVGIEKVVGDFMKNDLVNILSPKGEKMGVGIAKYDAATLREHCGHKDKPVFIHHDHCYIF